MARGIQKAPSDVYWLDNRQQAARAGKSWLTLTRWMDDPEMKYPRPERYFKKTPVTRLATIEAWEATRPTQPPAHPNLNPPSRQRQAARDVQPVK